MITTTTRSLPRLLAAPDPSLAAHVATFGPRPQRDPRVILDELATSGLRGRGGAGFPAWRKWASVPDGRGPVVIGNGAEGEPLSAKDATLLASAPHLVIDGLLIAAESVHAHEIWWYVSDGSLPAVTAALAERPDARRIRVHEAVDRFVSGESSAAISAIGGGRGLPTDRLVPASVKGLRGRPTLVHNVETLAQVALIARYGGHWFATAGTPEDPGSRLVSVTEFGRARPPVVSEVTAEQSLADLLDSAGIDPDGLRAVLVGGFHGTWVDGYRHDLHRLSMDAESLSHVGAAPGAGILIALPAAACPLRHLAEVADYLAGESAGLCGPCLNGLPAIAATLRRIAGGDRDPRLVPEVRRLSQLVDGRGSCTHPDGTVRMVLSGLAVFADEVDAHLGGRCQEVRAA